MKPLLVYLIIINALGLMLMLSDKQRAKKKQWRIPERTLLTVAVIGGSIGILMGMRLFRHKTLHKAFALGVPLIICLQLICSLLIYLLI